MRAGAQPVLVIQGEPSEEIARAARHSGWKVVHASSPDEPLALEAAAVALDRRGASYEWRSAHPRAILIALEEGVDADVPPVRDATLISGALSLIARTWGERCSLRDELARARAQRTTLCQIGVALAAQAGPERLLETILAEARQLADCEAGSLYLVEPQEHPTHLVFKLTQNERVALQLDEERLPLSTESVAGYVALTGNELNIEDAYDLPANAPYRFNRSFDERMGFRTQSMLVIPMRDHRGRLTGVLQFINRRVRSADGSMRIAAFDDEMSELLTVVASQAAISIQKSTLIRDINRLFESFVLASVKAIEQRDPSTSGHSFRVAETTLALMTALPRSGLARFKSLALTDEHLTEVRYAALLHDFGKVGVREQVLVKANKLTAERLELLRYRFELQKERLRRAAVERELALLHDEPANFDVSRRRVRRELGQKLSMVDDFFTAITLANNPNVLADGDFAHLRAIRDYQFRELDGSVSGLITDADLLALSVRQGSLTPEERREIQSHVLHTIEFLEVLPWPPELGRVAEIAAAHHEKLDGSGYPYGLAGDQIPLASRAMAVCDIYDALTANDRPYKHAVSLDTALRILDDEAHAGMLDEDLVRIFAEARCFEAAGNQPGDYATRKTARPLGQIRQS